MKSRVWWLIGPALLLLAALLDRPRATKALHQAEWLPAGDARVRAVRAGHGDTTLLLLHGFGESLFTWQAIFDRLAQTRRVVAIDLPGFGGSEKPVASYSLPAMTARLASLIDRESSGPIIAVGHSMGGELATALALDRPDRVVALILIAPAGWTIGLGGIADTMYPDKARAIGWYLASRAFLLPEHDPAWLGEPDKASAYTLVTDSAYRISAATILEQFDFRALRGRFQEVRQPVLLMWGGLDPVIPFALVDSISTQLPCRQVVTFPKALHRPQVEIPDTVLTEILRFAAKPSCEN